MYRTSMTLPTMTERWGLRYPRKYATEQGIINYEGYTGRARYTPA
jgi:hypothetical protein